MATNYRDIGYLGAQEAPQVPIDTQRYTQVYRVTHDGTQRLPYMNRSFISFTYGGKFIEDFNLIAYTNGDRMQRDAYASFNDLTSSYDVIPGQFYWGTYYSTNSLSLFLFTDGMTQQELDDFKYWFRAGSIRELILAEHPNRAIMARVSSPPQLNVLPFETEVTVPFSTGAGEATREYTTSSTIYRGDISLELIMDSPFWYSKQNLLGIQNTLGGYYEEQWVDANGNVTNIRDCQDALKIVYEDHIPLGSTVAISVFLGGDVYASVAYEIWSQIVQSSTAAEWEKAQSLDAVADAQTRNAYFKYEAIEGLESEAVGTISSEDETPSEENEGEEDSTGSGEENIEGEQENTKEQPTKQLYYYKGALIAEDDGSVGARVGGAQTSGTSEQANGISLLPGEPAYLYYAGNAPSPVKLSFTLKPTFTEYYITLPGSKYNKKLPYNTLTLEATMKHEFKFTLPTFWLSYNQVLEIFDNESIMRAGNAWLTVRETIRDTIRHPIIRKWANLLINKYDYKGGTGIISGDTYPLEKIVGDLKYGMMMLFKDNGEATLPAHFTFNGNTGEAIGEFQYRNLAEDINFIHAYNAVTDMATLRTQILDSSPEDYLATSVENVGDMVKSSYLILDERNVLDNMLQVQAWEETHPDYAYKITHDLDVGVSEGLQNLHFEFKNLYL